MEEPKIDKNGWKYYDKMPVGFRKGCLDDFHFHGKKKTGMVFLIQWALTKSDYYQVCVVSENLTSTWLNQFIKDNRVFVYEQNEH